MDIKLRRSMGLLCAVLFCFAINCTTVLASPQVTEAVISADTPDTPVIVAAPESLPELISEPIVVADTAVHVINLMPLFNILLPLFGVVFTLLGVAGILWLQKKVGVEKLFEKDKLYDMVDKQMDQAVAYGIQQLEKADWTKIETKNAILAGAANFMVDHADDLLNKTGMTEAKLKALLEAKLMTVDQNPGTWEQTEQK